jgi:hypothetical protein
MRCSAESSVVRRTHLPPAEKITDGVLQDALKEQRQLGGRLVPVALRQPHHRVLNDVERSLLVADVKHA